MTPAPPALRELTADDIQWDLQPSPEPRRDPDDVLVDAVIDGLSYRLIVLESFDALRALTLQLDREREQRAQLKTEYAALRAQTMREAIST